MDWICRSCRGVFESSGVGLARGVETLIAVVEGRGLPWCHPEMGT